MTVLPARVLSSLFDWKAITVDVHSAVAEVPDLPDTMTVRVELNGRWVEQDVEPRTSLLDFVREQGCTGTHASCEHGVCGACTLLLDGQPVRSCLVLVAQADGGSVATVESLGDASDPDPLQVAFSQERGLQCGFCTPGFLMLARGLLAERPDASQVEVRDALSSNLCRCTGYDAIVRAVERVASAGRRSDDGTAVAPVS
jgi:carbon-monoxide dehydrogenase small subunit